MVVLAAAAASDHADVPAHGDCTAVRNRAARARVSAIAGAHAELAGDVDCAGEANAATHAAQPIDDRICACAYLPARAAADADIAASGQAAEAHIAAMPAPSVARARVATVAARARMQSHATSEIQHCASRKVDIACAAAIASKMGGSIAAIAP